MQNIVLPNADGLGCKCGGGVDAVIMESMTFLEENRNVLILLNLQWKAFQAGICYANSKLH